MHCLNLPPICPCTILPFKTRATLKERLQRLCRKQLPKSGDANVLCFSSTRCRRYGPVEQNAIRIPTSKNRWHSPRSSPTFLQRVRIRLKHVTGSGYYPEGRTSGKLGPQLGQNLWAFHSSKTGRASGNPSEWSPPSVYQNYPRCSGI